MRAQLMAIAIAVAYPLGAPAAGFGSGVSIGGGTGVSGAVATIGGGAGTGGDASASFGAAGSRHGAAAGGASGPDPREATGSRAGAGAWDNHFYRYGHGDPTPEDMTSAPVGPGGQPKGGY